MSNYKHDYNYDYDYDGNNCHKCRCFTALGLHYTHLNFNAFPKAARCRYSRFNRSGGHHQFDRCCGSKANPCNPKYGPKHCYH